MQNRIEPPVLLSRLMTFVFAAMLVVTMTLIVTLYELFPMNRPQVFFLMTQPRSEIGITLLKMSPKDENFENFKQGFIREYIVTRNEIVPDIKIMRRKWDKNGFIDAWSTPEIYDNFTQTGLWDALMNDIPNFEFSCPVEIHSVSPTNEENTYTIDLSYSCVNSNGQTDKKEYTIRMKLGLNNDTAVRWTGRLDNPLGLRVEQYEIIHGDGDPLNTGYSDNNSP